MASKQRLVWLPFRTANQEFDNYESIPAKSIAAVKFTSVGAEVWELTKDGTLHRGTVRERSAVKLLRDTLARTSDRWFETTIADEGYRSATETGYANRHAIAHIKMPNETTVSERYFEVELRGGQKFGRIAGDEFQRFKQMLEATTTRLSGDAPSEPAAGAKA